MFLARVFGNVLSVIQLYSAPSHGIQLAYSIQKTVEAFRCISGACSF